MARLPPEGGLHSDAIREIVDKDNKLIATVYDLVDGYGIDLTLNTKTYFVSTHYPPKPRKFSKLESVRTYFKRLGILEFTVIISN